MDTLEFWFGSVGTRLFAVESGSGAPIILLHGGLANHLAARHFGAPLADHHRLVTPDVRASGRSVFGGPLTWDLLADDVAALVAHLGVERAVIGGVSSGSGVAVRVALRHPHIVAALVVLTPVFAGADVGLAPESQAAMHAMNALGSRVVAEGIDALLPIFDALPPPTRDRARAMAAAYDPASVAATTAFLASGAQPFATAAELAAITARTLVVPGTDPTHPRAVAELYARHLPSCTFRDAAPPEWAAAIADFVG